MDLMEFENDSSSPRAPRTTTVLVFLAAFAVILSYLAIYAATNALIAADLISPWPQEADPRPGWMLRAFVGMFAACATVGILFRFFSHRQLKRIDAMADAEE
jgi:hypothetical protein